MFNIDVWDDKKQKDEEEVFHYFFVYAISIDMA